MIAPERFEVEPAHGQAEVLAHSITKHGDEVATVSFWLGKSYLAEFNKHRALANSVGSARAVPVRKFRAMAAGDNFFPVAWPREKSGMSGGEQVEDLEKVVKQWTGLRNEALTVTQSLADLGLHKSLTNRLIEPWIGVKVVATGSAWENFFRQRIDDAAQPEIRVAAESIHAALAASTPTLLDEGEFHLPYVGTADREFAYSREGALLIEQRSESLGYQIDEQRLLAQISSARCARTSYLTNPVIDQAGNVIDPARVDISKDLRLYSDLVGAEPRHWSPLEHPCTPWAANKQTVENGMPWLNFRGPGGHLTHVETKHLPRIGSVYGYRTLRTEVESMLGEVTFR